MPAKSDESPAITSLYQEVLLNEPDLTAVAALLRTPGARSGMPKRSLRLFSESDLPGKRG